MCDRDVATQTTNQASPNQHNQRAASEGFGFRLCCFRCDELGHRISKCNGLESLPRKNLLVKEELMNFTNNKDDSISDGDVLDGNGNTTLVIKKHLLTPKGDCDEDWRRSNVFHSICTIKDKVYSLIIDSRSYENMVSTEVVRKLQLTTVNHLKPCKLTWMNKDIEVIVDRRYLVYFFMGQKYFDSAWYDVVSIDAYHILLWRS